MKILVLGSGGREHAMVRALERGQHEVVWAPGNGAQGNWRTLPLDLTDLDQTVGLALAEKVDLTLVGPEDPLAAGLVNQLLQAGQQAWGPDARSARLESSKAWAKQFLQRHGLPTADFAVATDLATASQAIATLWSEAGVVVKADGLAAGKGVVVAASQAEAEQTAEAFLQGKLGEAGQTLIIEQCLSGPEASLIMLLRPDGYQVFPLVRDHKRLGEGDRGPNTGGMGAVTPITDGPPLQGLLDDLWEALKKEDLNYFGALFVGLMLCPEGPQILEFNCRLGDPEAEVLLESLHSDFLGALYGDPMHLAGGCTVDVVLASAGYPESSTKGALISGLDEVTEVAVLQAGTARDPEGRLITAGGRVLHVVAHGDDLAQARQRAYAAVAHIRFDGKVPLFRQDIGGNV